MKKVYEEDMKDDALGLGPIRPWDPRFRIIDSAKKNMSEKYLVER